MPIFVLFEELELFVYRFEHPELIFKNNMFLFVLISLFQDFRSWTVTLMPRLRQTLEALATVIFEQCSVSSSTFVQMKWMNMQASRSWMEVPPVRLLPTKTLAQVQTMCLVGCLYECVFHSNDMLV